MSLKFIFVLTICIQLSLCEFSDTEHNDNTDDLFDMDETFMIQFRKPKYDVKTNQFKTELLNEFFNSNKYKIQADLIKPFIQDLSDLDQKFQHSKVYPKSFMHSHLNEIIEAKLIAISKLFGLNAPSDLLGVKNKERKIKIEDLVHKYNLIGDSKIEKPLPRVKLTKGTMSNKIGLETVKFSDNRLDDIWTKAKDAENFDSAELNRIKNKLEKLQYKLEKLADTMDTKGSIENVNEDFNNLHQTIQNEINNLYVDVVNRATSIEN